MTGELAEKYSQPASNLYDLGCSLGASTFAMCGRVPADCCLKAIDASPEMGQRMRQLLNEFQSPRCRIEVETSLLQDVSIENASFVVLNYTLQFVPRSERATVLQTIYDGMRPGSAMVLSEKICFEDPVKQNLMTDLHHTFKRANGYSDLEIAQKRSALEQTMIPESIETHFSRLQKTGFTQAALWFQCFNFASFLAIKT